MCTTTLAKGSKYKFCSHLELWCILWVIQTCLQQIGGSAKAHYFLLNSHESNARAGEFVFRWRIWFLIIFLLSPAGCWCFLLPRINQDNKIGERGTKVCQVLFLLHPTLLWGDYWMGKTLIVRSLKPNQGRCVTKRSCQILSIIPSSTRRSSQILSFRLRLDIVDTCGGKQSSCTSSSKYTQWWKDTEHQTHSRHNSFSAAGVLHLIKWERCRSNMRWFLPPQPPPLNHKKCFVKSSFLAGLIFHHFRTAACYDRKV